MSDTESLNSLFSDEDENNEEIVNSDDNSDDDTDSIISLFSDTEN